MAVEDSRASDRETTGNTEKVHGTAESTFPVESGNSRQNSPDRQYLEGMSENETVAGVATETSDLGSGDENVGDVVEEEVRGTASLEDDVGTPTQGRGPEKTSDRQRFSDDVEMPAFRRSHRSCSLDRSKPLKLTR